MKVYPCPICGQSKNRHGEPMDTPQKTAGHIDGARDDAHDGESGAENMQAIRENETEVDRQELEGLPEPSESDGTEDVTEPSEETAITSKALPTDAESEEMGLREWAQGMDAFAEAVQSNNVENHERLDGVEEEIEELGDEIEETGRVMNRVLGYLQAIADAEGYDGVVEDMQAEGFVESAE